MSAKPPLQHILRPLPKRVPLYRSGFTLVEMMIVIAVIALLATVAAPSVTRMRRRETSREFANAIANQLRYARMQAKTQGMPLLVTITPGQSDSDTPGSINVLRGLPYCRSESGGSVGSNGRCDDNMPPKPPMSCAELADPTVRKEVLKLDSPTSPPLRSISSYDYIAGTSGSGASGAGTPFDICISPDGRVLSPLGQVLPDNGTLCSGENFLIYTASRFTTDRIYTDTPEKLAACPNSPMPDNHTETARDELNLYRITLPYNGAIRVSQ